MAFLVSQGQERNNLYPLIPIPYSLTQYHSHRSNHFTASIQERFAGIPLA